MSSVSSITIVVALYNVEQYVNHLFQSLVSQPKFSQVKVLAIDDSSSDDTFRKAEKYAKNYSNIELQKVSHRGLGAVRNYGLDKASTEYIAFIDGDDFVSGDYLQEMFVAMVDHPDLMVFQWRFADENNKAWGDKHAYLTLKGMDRMAWNKVYSAKLVQNLRFPEGVLYEDFGFTTLAYRRAESRVFIPKSLYYYRQRNSSITKREVDPRKHLDVLEVINHMYEEDNDLMSNNAEVALLVNELIYSHVRKVIIENYSEKRFVWSTLRKLVSELKSRKSFFPLPVRKVTANVLLILICLNMKKTVLLLGKKGRRK